MNKTITTTESVLQVLDQATMRRYQEVSDEQLLEQVAAGDVHAGMYLVFHRHGDALQKLAAKFAEHGCYDALLRELVSEVYYHFASHGWSRLLSRQVDNLGGYLYKTVLNLLLQMVRRTNRHLPAEFSAERLEGGEEQSTDAVAAFEAADQLERAMARISATRQFVVRKRLVEGYGSKEVAEMLPGYWNSIGEHHAKMPTNAYVDNIVSSTRKDLLSTLSR